MKKLYRFGAAIFAVLAGLAAIGAGAIIVATAVIIGGLIAMAAKLAISGASLKTADKPQDDNLGFKEGTTTCRH
jgi:uncharacterized membrane protein